MKIDKLGSETIMEAVFLVELPRLSHNLPQFESAKNWTILAKLLNYIKQKSCILFFKANR